VLLSFMTFGLAFVARPVGAIAFGHFGDRVGRKSTLVASLMLMGGSTMLIAFLPTYAMAGPAAPALLCLLRFGQGFGLGGEWGGASLLAVENAPKGWEARFGAAPQLGAPLGFSCQRAVPDPWPCLARSRLCQLGLARAVSGQRAPGWPGPVGAAQDRGNRRLFPRRGSRAAAQGAVRPPHGRSSRASARRDRRGGRLLCDLLPRHHLCPVVRDHEAGLCQAGIPGVQLAANFFLAAGIALAGWWADKRGPAAVLRVGAGLTALVGLVFGAGLGSGHLPLVFATLAIALFVMGLVYGPLGAWLPTLYAVPVRYTGISIAFNVGGIIGGALAPFAAQALAQRGGTASVGLFLTVAGAVTLLGVLFAPKAAR
jgi:MFS family permease